MKSEYVSKVRFMQEVELWRYKGHEHVVRVEFNSSTMILCVNDYVLPEVEYKLMVIDTTTADNELANAKLQGTVS